MHILTYTPTFSLWYYLTIEGRWRINTNQIADRLRKLRLRKQLTQQELAALCNFPGPRKISRLEGGKKGSGIERIDTLEVVCQELGIELWELLKPDFVIPGEKPVEDENETKRSGGEKQENHNRVGSLISWRIPTKWDFPLKDR